MILKVKVEIIVMFILGFLSLSYFKGDWGIEIETKGLKVMRIICVMASWIEIIIGAIWYTCYVIVYVLPIMPDKITIFIGGLISVSYVFVTVVLAHFLIRRKIRHKTADEGEEHK